MRAKGKPAQRPISASHPQRTRPLTSASVSASAASSSLPGPSRGPAPLSLALHAQWSLLQRGLELGGIPVDAERDLLRVLESLPDHKAAILSDVEGVLPYILAFAVAPIPTERTQVIALEALRATIGSLVSVWGKSASAVLVHDFLVVEHNALQALAVALSVALGEDEDAHGEDRSMRETKKPPARRTAAKSTKQRTAIKKAAAPSPSPSPSSSLPLSIHRAVIGGVLELLLVMITVSSPTAVAALSHPNLIRSVARCVPLVAPVQACDAANILLILSGVTGAADVLITCGVFDYAMQYILCSIRDAPCATVTALVLILRLSIALAAAPESFDALRSDPNAAHMFDELLHSQWDEVTALGAEWLAVSLTQHRAVASTLAVALLRGTHVGARLALRTLSAPTAVVSTSSAVGTVAAQAARCWREMALAAPTEAAAFFLTDPQALLALVQALGAATEREREGRGSAHSEVNRVGCVDVAVALGLCAGWAARDVRVELRRALLRRLSPEAQTEILRRVSTLFASDTAVETLSSLPPMESLPGPSDAERSSSSSSSDVGESSGREGWRRRLLRALMKLFSGEAHGPAAVAMLYERAQWQQPHSHPRVRPLQQQQQQQWYEKEKGHYEPLGFGVVRRAEQMGGAFYLESIQSILCLAHHYARFPRAASAPAPRRTVKAPNPWAPPEPVESSRRWSVEDLRRSDAMLFYVSFDKIGTELAEAIEMMEEHTKRLGEALRVCPTREVRRRCLLNDLYMHVYPKMHMFLRFIQHHVACSRVAVQIIEDGPRAVHSGNVLQLYEAIGHCVGAPAAVAETTKTTSRKSSMEWRSHR